MYYGRGAGRMPTASAVIADVVDVARRGDFPPMPAFVYTQTLPIRGMDMLEGRYYLRVSTQDRPGALGRICGVLGEHEINIASCFQRESTESDLVHVVLITHKTAETAGRVAVDEIDQLGFVQGATQMLRVL